MKNNKIMILMAILILCTGQIFAVDVASNETQNTSNNNDDDFGISNEPIQDNLLEIGKNNFTTRETFSPIYVKDFINQYPDIEVVSYKMNGETIGYVNFLNGIGEDFIMYPNQKYEIITKLDIIIQDS